MDKIFLNTASVVFNNLLLVDFVYEHATAKEEEIFQRGRIFINKVYEPNNLEYDRQSVQNNIVYLMLLGLPGHTFNAYTPFHSRCVEEGLEVSNGQNIFEHRFGRIQ